MWLLWLVASYSFPSSTFYRMSYAFLAINCILRRYMCRKLVRFVKRSASKKNFAQYSRFSFIALNIIFHVYFAPLSNTKPNIKCYQHNSVHIICIIRRSTTAMGVWKKVKFVRVVILHAASAPKKSPCYQSTAIIN